MWEGRIAKVRWLTAYVVHKDARRYDNKIAFTICHIASVVNQGQSKAGHDASITAHAFWDWEFNVTPSTTSAPYQAICRDFARFLEQKTGKKFSLEVSPAGNFYNLHHPDGEFEVYSAFFDPGKREEGIQFMTGRSAYAVADRETTRLMFKEFIDRVSAKEYRPSDV